MGAPVRPQWVEEDEEGEFRISYFMNPSIAPLCQRPAHTQRLKGIIPNQSRSARSPVFQGCRVLSVEQDREIEYNIKTE